MAYTHQKAYQKCIKNAITQSLHIHIVHSCCCTLIQCILVAAHSYCAFLLLLTHIVHSCCKPFSEALFAEDYIVRRNMEVKSLFIGDTFQSFPLVIAPDDERWLIFSNKVILKFCTTLIMQVDNLLVLVGDYCIKPHQTCKGEN